MTDRTPYAEEAAELAQGVIQAMLDRAEEDTRGEGRMNFYLGLIYDALGWALYKAGRVEEGRNEIERALKFSQRNTRAHYHLGQMFEHMATEAEGQPTLGSTRRRTPISPASKSEAGAPTPAKRP